MKKLILLTILLIATITSFGGVIIKPKKVYDSPVLVRCSNDEMRIGFMRSADYNDIKEDVTNPDCIHATFLDDAELTNSVFVYYPTSENTGEVVIVKKLNIVKIEMTYERAMKLLNPYHTDKNMCVLH